MSLSCAVKHSEGLGESIDHSPGEWSFTDRSFLGRRHVFLSLAFFFCARGEQTQLSPGLWLSLAERVGAAKRLYLIVVWNINHPIPACPSPTRHLASRINKTAEYQRAASHRSLINPGSRDEISPVKLLDAARSSGCKGGRRRCSFL